MISRGSFQPKRFCDSSVTWRDTVNVITGLSHYGQVIKQTECKCPQNSSGTVKNSENREKFHSSLPGCRVKIILDNIQK